MPNKPYTEQEMQFIADNWETMTDREIAAEMGRTAASVKTWRQRNGLLKHSSYSDTEIKYIREHYPSERTDEIAEELGRSTESIYAKAYSLGLTKSEEFMNSEKSGRMKPGQSHPGSKATQFKKGAVPHNKGMKGVWYPGSEKTWFKKGRKPHNTKWDGAISVRKQKGISYMWIRISESNWKMVQHHLWEKENGPIPDDKLLVCKDGNTLNVKPDNWELITRAEHARRNHNPEKMMETLMKNENHASIHLTDNYVAAMISGGDKDIKEYLLNERPDVIRTARAAYKLKRQLNTAQQ